MAEFVALDALPAAALTCDPAGILTGVNDGWAELFMTPRRRLVGARLVDLFPSEGEVAARLAASAHTSVRLHARRATGVPFTAEVRATASADGSLTCLLWHVIGERLQWESQIQ